MHTTKTALATAALATTEEDFRYALQYVQVRPDGTCTATDGAILLSVTPPPIKADDLPLALQDGYADAPILVATQTIKQLSAVSWTSKARRNMPHLETTVALTPDAATVLDSEWHPITIHNTTDPGQFPAYERVIPQPSVEDTVFLTLSPDYLIMLGRAAKKMDAKSLTFQIPTHPKHVTDGNLHSAIRIEGNPPFADSGKLLAVVMPMRR